NFDHVYVRSCYVKSTKNKSRRNLSSDKLGHTNKLRRNENNELKRQIDLNARRVKSLIVHGRIIEARDAWIYAVRNFGKEPPPQAVNKLYKNVVHLLLQRGELDFAELIFNDLSRNLANLSWVRTERRLYSRLDQAARDQLVFPSSIDLRHRWEGPHLVPTEM